MFQRDQREIGAYAQSSPKAMNRVITFVYTTIQQNLLTTPNAMRDIEINGVESPYLWGFKADAYEYVTENMDTVYRTLMDTWRGHADIDVASRETMRYLCTLPGLGLVKAGFVQQLAFGTVGCIDGHNQKMYEIKEYRFKASRYKAGKPALQRRMLDDYLHVCWDVGGSEFLWDNWCAVVADRNKMTADAVSALHVEAII